MPGMLDGMVALVTGASSGIGEATAFALAKEGAEVAIAARRVDRLESLNLRIVGAGGRALPIAADVADEAQARQMVDKTVEEFGRIDVLINNAGVMLLAPVLEADPEDWRRMVNTNLLGLMYATHAALPHMRARSSGHIVNISSTAGRVSNPRAAVYSATKFGVGAFSESLRREVYSLGIRVTIVEPGVVETELRDHITHKATQNDLNQWADSMRQLQPADVAAAIVYAVSQPAHVNVNEILVRPTDQER